MCDVYEFYVVLSFCVNGNSRAINTYPVRSITPKTGRMAKDGRRMIKYSKVVKHFLHYLCYVVCLLSHFT